MTNSFKQVKRTVYPVQWRDLVRALIVANHIREGVWRLGFKYGLSGMSVQWQGAEAQHTRPAATVVVDAVYLFRVDQEDAISVDAEKVWAEVEATEAPATVQ